MGAGRVERLSTRLGRGKYQKLSGHSVAYVNFKCELCACRVQIISALCNATHLSLIY